MANPKAPKKGGNSSQPPKKKGGFNPGARKHMGSEAYKGRMKKIKSDLIHKAKVKKDYAKVLKQEQDNTPEFYKKIFGARTIDDDGNVVAYKPEGGEDKSDDEDQTGSAASGSENEFEVDLDASEEDSSDDDGDDDDEESEDQRSSKKRKAQSGVKGGKKKGDEPQKKHKPNPFKGAIEKRERDMKAQQEAREGPTEDEGPGATTGGGPRNSSSAVVSWPRPVAPVALSSRSLAARRAKEDARQGREKYFAKRQKQSAKLRQKTERGQPKLGNHIQMLLGKIKQDVKKNETRVPARRPGNKKKPQA
ncbi:hypothetical protein DFQ27_007175 [Actinomortierella ambigua]|uniref:rRNA-processing protein FYV7 n=1 Tax=Actinomortierella ambigua TaxID=1343610 RepID=A0A9P6PX71_9FUNG|nr:hypothetical protein DFQ27_007175 [Actinomortierella ambigua]